ncbi:MAG: RluA family pseudouridine synthase [Treponema sp.]|nr:RluA family pseudouridine synthase [Treponema sp.]
MELITGENDKGRRLDRILRKALPECPLPLIHRLLRQGQVKINGKPAKAQDRLDSGAAIYIPSIKDTHGSAQAGSPLPSANIIPSSVQECNFSQLEILWQGCGLLAVNKPPGLAVHGNDSLNEMVLSFLAGKTPHSLSFKPGPLHRLDKPSSGIVIFSVNIEGARMFSSLMRERKVKKTYLAVVEGAVEKEETWTDELVRDSVRKKSFISYTNNDELKYKKVKSQPDSKTAVTKVMPLKTENGYTLIKAEITTGRTHQIRVQASSHGHPLAGDIKYGASIANEKRIQGENHFPQFFLHAWRLEFLEYTIEAPPGNLYERYVQYDAW